MIEPPCLVSDSSSLCHHSFPEGWLIIWLKGQELWDMTIFKDFQHWFYTKRLQVTSTSDTSACRVALAAPPEKTHTFLWPPVGTTTQITFDALTLYIKDCLCTGLISLKYAFCKRNSRTLTSFYGNKPKMIIYFGYSVTDVTLTQRHFGEMAKFWWNL